MPQSNVSRAAVQPNFTFHESLVPWNTSLTDWLIQNHKEKVLDGVATGSLVFNPKGEVLLIQRASHDSMPNRWEVPGGAADPEDATLLHAAARELHEEAGLIAKRFTHVVAGGPDQTPGFVFRNSTGSKAICQFVFRVEVLSCGVVKLDPNEHQDFVWASEKEFHERKAGSRELTITTDNVAAIILEAFRLEKLRPESL